MAMSRNVAGALVLALAAHAETRVHSDSSVTPLQKVVSMLGDMSAKGKKEKHTEEVAFAEFQQWCDGTRDSTKKSIAEAADKIVQLEADIEKANADAEEADADAADYSATADKDQAELDAATKVRKEEKADYDATHKDLSESIDAIERAIATLKARTADVPQSLIQLRAATDIPAETKESIESLLAMSQSQTPEANAYEFQSGGVVDMLEKLRLKFQDERLALQKAEMVAKGNYEVLAQKLTASVADAKKRASAKTEFKAQRLEDAARAKGDLELTKTGKAEDEKELSDTLAACESRSQEFENNQVVRSGEIKAIEQALEILNSDAVSGNADEHLPGSAALVQEAVALAQLRGNAEASEARQRIVDFLQSRAKSINSRYLRVVAKHMTSDPFAKVKKMIKDLIVKLMEEANSEADHNAYCTTELATNKQTREDKTAEVEDLTAKLEKKTAESAQLATEVKELSAAVATIKSEQAEATKLREDEKAVNTKTIADAKEAQVAVERATQVLKDFYGKASEASLLQSGTDGELSQEMSQAAKAPYKGMQSESGGIIGFLEVVLSDFARLESETSAAEQESQEQYEKYMAETEQDVAVKDTEIKHKNGAQLDADTTIADLNKELELTNEELSAAQAYHEKLKPDCVDKGLSYEERVQKREEEIQSLQEALRILTQEDLA